MCTFVSLAMEIALSLVVCMPRINGILTGSTATPKWCGLSGTEEENSESVFALSSVFCPAHAIIDGSTKNCGFQYSQDLNVHFSIESKFQGFFGDRDSSHHKFNPKHRKSKYVRTRHKVPDMNFSTIKVERVTGKPFARGHTSVQPQSSH